MSNLEHEGNTEEKEESSMKGYFKGTSKLPIKLIPLTVLLLIVYTALSLYIANFSRTEMNQQVENFETEREDLEWMSIQAVIENSYALSKKESKILALEVEYALRTAYPNLTDLETQFDNSEFTTEFNSVLTSILSSRWSDTESMLTLVGTNEHLISMFSNNSDHILSSLNSESAISWSDVSELTPNSYLTNTAVSSIIKRSGGIIYTFESDIGYDGNDINMSIRGLKKIYDEKGIEALRGVVLLAPAYITDNGDIFGTDDTNFLKNNNTHKIVIVKAVGLGEILHSNYDITEDLLKITDSIYSTTYSQGDRTVFISIIWAALSFLISLFLIRIYNTEEQKGHLCEKKDKKGGSDETMRGE